MGSKIKGMLNKPVMFFDAIIRWIDEGSPVDVIYVDFQKAFNHVSHKTLNTLKAKTFGNGMTNKQDRALIGV